MIRTNTSRLLAAGAIVATLAAIPSAAFAASNATASGASLANCHTRADAEIQRRLTTLADDLKVVNGATHLTAADKQTLVGTIAGDQSGLTQLKATIDATTDLATCHADAMTIVTAYRVYVLVGPKIRLTIGADRIQAVGSVFTDLSPKLQTAINNAKAHGKPVEKAQAALDAMNAKVAAALAAAGPVPGQVLPLQPSGYPANQATLKAARQSLETARQDVRAARVDAAQVVADLH